MRIHFNPWTAPAPLVKPISLYIQEELFKLGFIWANAVAKQYLSLEGGESIIVGGDCQSKPFNLVRGPASIREGKAYNWKETEEFLSACSTHANFAKSTYFINGVKVIITKNDITYDLTPMITEIERRAKEIQYRLR